MNWAKIGLFAAGVLFGTAGIKVLGSKDAKKVYHCSCSACQGVRHDNGHDHQGERKRHPDRR